MSARNSGSRSSPEWAPTRSGRPVGSWKHGRNPASRAGSHAVRERLEGAVVAYGHPRAAAWREAAAQLDEPGHPIAVAGIGLEELEHAVIVGDPSGQRPADRPG